MDSDGLPTTEQDRRGAKLVETPRKELQDWHSEECKLTLTLTFDLMHLK